ncbi:MAG TPA: dihydrofolate reductase family protein [Hyphomonadaceae bacterium]|nr:dihydrofolate reductase family protein [Hyphomonadaceae bacterium]
MRKIIVGAQVSLDGVMQAPGAPMEDPTGGFPFGGWVVPYFHPVFDEEIGHVLTPDRDLLLGRKTYEIFAAYWPHYDEAGPAGRIATLFNTITKYVVSGSGEVDTSWKGTVVLRDIDAVRRLREAGGRDLVTQGSTALLHALFEHDLVDALSTFTVPLVLGQGKKLFADGSAPHSYTMVRSRMADNGLMVAHYERAGGIATGDTSVDAPNPRELTRRERMRKEG